jgi:hypothetical protein
MWSEPSKILGISGIGYSFGDLPSQESGKCGEGKVPAFSLQGLSSWEGVC